MSKEERISRTHTAPPRGRRQRRPLTSQFHRRPEVNHRNETPPTLSVIMSHQNTHTHTDDSCASLLHPQGELLTPPRTSL